MKNNYSKLTILLSAILIFIVAMVLIFFANLSRLDNNVNKLQNKKINKPIPLPTINNIYPETVYDKSEDSSKEAVPKENVKLVPNI